MLSKLLKLEMIYLKLYCLIGESGVGKDTILNRLLTLRKDLKSIITYTTRPIRNGEKNGKEYYFVSNKSFERLKESNLIVEYRKYQTIHGDWYYFMSNDKQIDTNSNDKYIVINTIFGVKKLKEMYGNSVIPLHIYVNDRDRLLRCFARESAGKEDFVEMCRRFVSDTKDYSADTFFRLKIPNNVFINDNLVECVNAINNFIGT